MPNSNQEALEQQKDLAELKHELSVEEQLQKLAGSMSAEKAKKTVQNPEFLRQLQDPDADTDLWDWVEDEVGPALSGAHIIGQRGEHYEEQQFLLNRNFVERLIAERTPGRLLRENPRLLALAQGIQGTEQYPDPTDNPAYRAPLTSRKRRVLRSVAEIITNRQALAMHAEGLSAVANATVENRTVSSEEEEASGVTARAKELYR